MTIYYIVILILNLTAFVLYGADKKKAKQHRWRIPEAVLLGIAASGGALGAFLGMELFRHKTKHLRFRLLIPLFLILHLCIAVKLIQTFS